MPIRAAKPYNDRRFCKNKIKGINMWKLNIFVLFIFIVLGIVFLVLGFNASPEAKTGDGFPLKTFFFIMGGFYIVLVTALFVGITIWRNKKQKELEWFKKFGIPGVAEIISAEQAGVYINRLPQVRLKLSITTGINPPYTLTIKRVFNLIEVGKLVPGAKLKILVDPQKPKRFIFI